MSEQRKVVAITGASGGIGKAASLEFHRKGWFVIMLDVIEPDYDFKTAELGDKNCCHIHCDVTNPEDLKEIFKGIDEITGGRLDLLINNAGIVEVGEFDSIPLETQLKIIDVNLKGVVNTTHAALPLLKKTNNSQIINLSSASALIGNPELTVYAATKSAVMSLTEGWSVGFKKYGIRVSDILPLKVRTAMVFDYIHKYQDNDEAGVKLTPEFIATKLYKASQKYRIHRYYGFDAAVFAFLTGVLPYSLQFWLLKKVIKYH